MNGRELSNLVGGRVGQPFTAQPDFDGEVGKFIVHDIEQATLDGDGRLSVSITGGGDQENLGWHTDVKSTVATLGR